MKTLTKVLQILDWIVHVARPVTLGEVAVALDLSMATAFRTLHSLEEHRLLSLDPETKTYRPGLGLWSLACLAIDRQGVLATVRPVLQGLVDETGESASYAMYDHGEIVYLDKVDSPRPVAAILKLGERAPAHCVSTGKVILAYLEGEALNVAIRESLARHKSPKYADEAALRAHLAIVRKKGYAINWGEYRNDIAGVAAPVMNHDHWVRTSIGISGPSNRLSPKTLDSYAQIVTRAANALSRQLGAVAPPLMSARSASTRANLPKPERHHVRGTP